MCPGRAAGIAAGYLADVALGDPRRAHPVALFGACAAGLERSTYADDRIAGALHTGVLLGALATAGVAAIRNFAIRRSSATGVMIVTRTGLTMALRRISRMKSLGTSRCLRLKGRQGTDLGKGGWFLGSTPPGRRSL